MKLSPEETKKVAKLANLTITEEETEKLSDQLSETLQFIEKLDELDTEKVEPTNSVTGLKDVMREDVISESLSQEAALKNAKSTEKGYFKVKAIFNEE